MIRDEPLAGVTTTERAHPAGRAGAMLSLREVAERAWKARMSRRLRAWVTQTVDRAGASDYVGAARASRRQKMQAVLDAYRKKVPYVPDPLMGEFMATPEQTLCLDEGGLCILGGDCLPTWTLLLSVPERASESFARGGAHALLDLPTEDALRPVPLSRVEAGQAVWGYDAPTDVLSVVDKGRLPLDLLALEGCGSLLLTADHLVYVAPSREGERPARVRVRDVSGGERLLMPPVDPTGQDRTVGAGEGRRVLSVQRAAAEALCRDVTTSDGYVYLPEHDVTVSNCDDATIVLVASALCLSIPAMVVGSSHRPPYDVPTHVFGAFLDDDGETWVRMDGTTASPLGHTAPRKREWWVEPGEQAKERGEGDFVGMAGAPDHAADLLYPGIR